MTTQLNGQFDLASASEDVALPGTTDVASFSDDNQTDTAGAFTATIDWGDGSSTTTGTVVGSNGSFTVEGGHTYADEGFDNATATIVRTEDNSQLVLSGTVPVEDTDNLTGHSAPTIAGNPNQALTNVTVATFTDTNTANAASDFTAAIDWGDGTTTGGTLSGANGTFTVSGSHTYATAGDFTITTFMNDDFPDTATAVATTTAAMGFGGTETLQSATEFTPISSGTEVAVFVDNSNLPASDYTATINWGDGTTTTSGTVSGSSGSYTITTSGHTYADEGLFTLTANIERTTDSATATASGTVTVDDADVLNASGTTINSPDQPLTNVTLATFSDTAMANVASDFLATIDWGDGTTGLGTISGSNGAFTVSGSHTYAQNGEDTISVEVVDDPSPGVATASAEATTTAIVGLAPGSGNDFSVLEGAPIAAGTVATFLDGNTADTAADFSAAIAWGDGTTTSATISGSNGSFTISGGPHTYADEGDDTITTTVTRTADQEQAAITGQATVGEADSFAVTADNISANPGQLLDNVPVATFTDTFIGQVAGDLTATISWGDGTSSAGTISGGGGSFTVLGSHAYTTGGNDTLTVTVSDDAPGTAAASATGSATINFGGQFVPPADTTADLIMDRPSTGDYEIYDFGNNTALAAQPLTQISAPWRVVGLGSFNGSDTSDMLLRNTTTGSLEIVDVSNNNASAPVLLGNVGLEVTVAGFGDFSGHPGETDMMMRNSISGDLVIYDFDNNAVPLSKDIGNVGLEIQVFGFGDFSGNANETDLLMHNLNTKNLVLYELSNNKVMSVATLGGVGPEWQFAGAGDFSSRPGETDMLARNTNNGDFELYDFQNGKITSTTALGNVGLEWQVAGFGDFSGNPDETDMLLRDMNNGNFELVDFRNNAVASVTMLGNVGLEWRVDGTAPYQLTGSATPASNGSDEVQTSLEASDPAALSGWLTQAMQTGSAPDQPPMAGAGLSGGPGAPLASGPGFDSGSALTAGTMPLASLATPNPMQQPHVG